MFDRPCNTDLRKFQRGVCSSISCHTAGASYRADKAGTKATARSERIRPSLVANRFHAISQASMRSAMLRNTELASQRLRSKRRAEKRTAHSASTSPIDPPGPPVATQSLRLSPRLDLKAARLSLAVYHCRLATRRVTVRHPCTDETTMRPIRRVPRSPRLVITGDRDSPVGKHFTNAFLIARHRPGKSASPRGKVHRQCI